MDQAQKLILDYINIWSTSESEKKFGVGRSSANARKIYGIEKLRELILSLAIHGKLVPQDSNEESAEELFKRIKLEQINFLTKKKKKPLQSVIKQQNPFILPNGWLWVSNHELFQLRKGKIPKNFNENGKGLPYLDIEALDRNTIRRYSVDTNCLTSKETDILVVCDGSRSGLILKGKYGIVGSTLSIIDTPIFIQPFINLIFKQGYENFNTSMKGAAIPHLDIQKLLQSVTGLPPLSEQHRIISKVDELMMLCDLLEQQHVNSNEFHKKLVKILLNTLTQSKDAEEFKDSWLRITNYFDTLFTTQESIEELKKTILHVAVMGRLTTQDPNDEPASELLKKIQAEKAKLINEGKIKKEKILPPMLKEKNTSHLPNGWTLVRLNDIGNTFIGLTYSPKDISHKGTPVLRSSNIQKGKLDLNDLVRVDKLIKDNLHVESGDLLICARNGSKSLVGKTAMIKDLLEPMTFGAFMAIYKSKLNNYIEIFLNSPLFRNTLEGVETTTINQITQNNLKTTLLPLPPINEQERISNKVKELIFLCDELKSRIHQACEKQKLISDVLVFKVLN
ncbi:restriction endonuclease subunit S [Candidatus Pelagibacter sp.]|nr:restriction endonuclease subunit S [Candidatus Pelagibacter sp.]